MVLQASDHTYFIQVSCDYFFKISSKNKSNQILFSMVERGIRCQDRKIFNSQKDQSLGGLDYSRKGSIDAPIVDLVAFINSRNDYFTLSSCSGRVCVFEEQEDGPCRKKGCRWLYTTHERCDTKLVMDALTQSIGDASLKYEGFILHVQCYSLEDAQTMHAVAVASGFRNSGITISKKGKIVVAVRTTHSLEVPLTQKGTLLVSEQYINYLCQNANQKMNENSTRIERLFQSLRAVTERDPVTQNDDRCKQKKRDKRKDHQQNSEQTPSNPIVQIQQDEFDENFSDLFVENDT